MNEKIPNKIKELCSLERIRFRKHALIRIVERGISINEIIESLNDCQVIYEYPEDKPIGSFLILGLTSKKRALHIVLAFDEKEDYLWVITVYDPDKNKWNKNFTKRI